MKHVMWVDDLIFDSEGNCTDLCNSIVNRAYEDFDIDIEAFKTYDDAYTEFLKNPTKWIAVILDVQNDSAEKNRNEDYMKGRRKFENYRAQHHVEEPYIYVFSGQESVNSNAADYYVKDHPLQDKSVYNKPADVELLLDNINCLANNSSFYKLLTRFKDVINDLNTLMWSNDSKNDVIGIIRTIEIEDNTKDDSVFNKIRKILESDLYIHLEKKGIMDDYETYLKKEKKESTINTKSSYIGKLPKERIPVYIQRAIHSLTEITNNGSHKSGANETSKLVSAKHVSNGKAPYLLKSCLYDLLTIIHWEANL